MNLDGVCRLYYLRVLYRMMLYPLPGLPFYSSKERPRVQV